MNVKKSIRLVGRYLNPIDGDGQLLWPQTVILYLLNNIFHIATWNARYWDQWYLYRDLTSLETIERNCPIYRCKVPFSYIWEGPLLNLGTWSLRISVVAIYLATGWLFWKLLRRSAGLSEQQTSLSTLFFLILPVFGARVGLSTARYSVLLFLMLCGALLLTFQHWSSLILGLTIIVYSEFQPSHQVFAICIVLLLATRDIHLVGTVTKRTKLVAVAIALAPLLVRFILNDLVVRYNFAGSDDGYNTITRASFVRALIVCGLLSTPLMVLIVRSLASSRPRIAQGSYFGAVSLAVLSLGSFAYMAVGHFANLTDWITVWLPDVSDWDSRHQVLQIFGFALLCAFGIQLLRQELQTIAVTAVIAVCLVINTSTFSNYYVDSLKQRDFINDLISKRDELGATTNFAIVDNAKDVNARGRGIRDYEWDVMLESALERSVKVVDLDWTSLSQGCQGEISGKVLTITKVSGRLIAVLTRKQIVSVQVSDLVTCQDG